VGPVRLMSCAPGAELQLSRVLQHLLAACNGTTSCLYQSPLRHHFISVKVGPGGGGGRGGGCQSGCVCSAVCVWPVGGPLCNCPCPPGSNRPIRKRASYNKGCGGRVLTAAAYARAAAAGTRARHRLAGGHQAGRSPPV
jgi:hypothetical protein